MTVAMVPTRILHFVLLWDSENAPKVNLNALIVDALKDRGVAIKIMIVAIIQMK